jgi:hypothetical protein
MCACFETFGGGGVGNVKLERCLRKHHAKRKRKRKGKR